MAATVFFGAILLAITAYFTVSDLSQWVLSPGPDLISAIYAVRIPLLETLCGANGCNPGLYLESARCLHSCNFSSYSLEFMRAPYTECCVSEVFKQFVQCREPMGLIKLFAAFLNESHFGSLYWQRCIFRMTQEISIFHIKVLNHV